MSCLVLAGLGVAQIWAQQVSTPGLHQRSDEPQDQAGAGIANSNESAVQASSLPLDVWGAYEFDHSRDTVELDLDRNKLNGYITRLGDAEADKNTPLTFFFDQSSINGSEIAFQTRVVHGVWYSFRGTVVRGDAKARGDEGYYVLRGVLDLHHPESGRDKSANETIERRQVRFKSVPQ